jgi:PAS domain S-box-containing protein
VVDCSPSPEGVPGFLLWTKMKYQDWHAGKWLIGFLSLLSAGIVVVGFLHYRTYKKNQWMDVAVQLHAITDLKKQDLVQWREERLSDGEYFRDNPYLSVLVRQALDNPQSALLRNQVQAWLHIIKNHSSQYDRIAILNVSGVEIYSAPNTPAIPSLVIRQSIILAEKSGKTQFVDFYRNEHDQKIYLAILVPIRGFDTNRVHAFLMLRIDPQLYLYPYIRRWPTYHTTSETLLVRREGSDALFLNELKYRSGMALVQRTPLSITDRPAVKAILGQSGYVVGRDYRGIPVVADVLAIPNSPWFLVARIDVAEAFASVRARLWEVLIGIGIMIGTAWMGGGFLWKRQRVQYYREKAEDAESLQELNEYLEITLKSIGDGVVVTDAKGIITGINPIAELLTGWPMPEAVGLPLTEVFPLINTQTRQPVENPIDKVLKTGVVVGLAKHTVLIGRNGDERQIADSASPIRDAAGRIRGVVLIFRDVTEEYTAAAELERNRLELKAIYEHAPVMMCAIDNNRHILNANHVFSEFVCKKSELFAGSPVCSILGCVHSLGNSWERVFSNACASCPLSQAIEATFRNGTAQHDIECHVSIVHNGECKEIVILCATALFPAAEHYYLLLYLVDITDRKIIEAKLRASEELHRKLIEAFPDVVTVIDLEGRITYCSSQGLTLFGVDRVEDYYGTPLSEWLIPEDRDLLCLNMANSLQGVFVLQNRYTALRKDGNRIMLEINAAPIAKTDGQPIGLVSVLRDVTHHVRVLDSLRESEERFRALFNSMEEGVAIHEIVKDAHGNPVDYCILDYNPAFVKHTGISPQYGVPASIIYGTGHPPYIEVYGRVATEGLPHHFEVFFAPLSRYFRISVVPGGPGRFATVFEDITERKLNESKLRASEAFSSGVLDSLTAHIAVINKDGVVVAVNEAWRQFASENGAPSGNRYVGMNYFTVCEEAIRNLGDKAAEASIHRIKEVMKGKKDALSLEYSCHSPKEERWFAMRATQFYTDDESYVVIAHENITKQKKAQEYLRLQEEFSRVLLENITDAVIACDANMNLVLFNRLAREWHGADVSRLSSEQWGSFYNLFDADGLKPLNRNEIPLIRAFEEGGFDPTAMTIKAQEQPTRYVMATGSAFYDNDGNKIGAVVVMWDITALRKSMEELQNSVHEKEALLREIHHRVKNNMQVISSLLSLESARIDNPGTQMTLRDMRNRIRSMALLHETLYSSESLAKVELAVYFERLCRHLMHSLLQHPEFIQLELEISPVFLDVSQAVPCGLLVNELVSNSLKHAFPNERSGVVLIKVTLLDEESSVCICVADNGVGLPEDFEQKRSHSLGLQLVSDLVHQLGGRLEIASTLGASFTFIFKPKTESQSELHYE